jgi:hypothetical protein
MKINTSTWYRHVYEMAQTSVPVDTTRQRKGWMEEGTMMQWQREVL